MKNDKKLSDHLLLSEFIASEKATENNINNSLPDELLPKAKLLAEILFEPIRALFDAPIHIDSGFRCQELNRLVRGVPTSQHCLVEALDMVPSNMSINDGIKKIINSNISFDQIIAEGTWLHVSCKVSDPSNNRYEILLTKDHKTYTHLTKEQANNWLS